MDFVYANDFLDTYSGTSRSARLEAVNINFRRWVPDGAVLPVTAGSGTKEAEVRAARETAAEAARQKTEVIQTQRRQTLRWPYRILRVLLGIAILNCIAGFTVLSRPFVWIESVLLLLTLWLIWAFHGSITEFRKNLAGCAQL